MQMEIALSPDRRFARCTVSGNANPDDAQRLLQSFRVDADASLPKRLLLDLLSVSGNLQMSDQFQVANSSTNAFQHFNRVAVVQAPRLNGGFGALVAKNRGLNMQVFDAESDALKWLLG
jgi:hypothetical protein